ncbi:reverse transcriptase domain-containing protein [Tanacetum coccineum]|uniref:Reverse transcriptase domain-containing protein n=1 Tax=Tanacetum coccineum TaxID=301880 RepID=A0ABQ4XZW3_9ASTR
MTKPTQKKVKFEWGDKQEAVFQLLKQNLCSAPILALPEGSKDFIIYCDAFEEGFGRCVDAKRKGKTNVVADALSRKEREPPLRVRALVMTISLDLPKQILNAQRISKMKMLEVCWLRTLRIQRRLGRKSGTPCGWNSMPQWQELVTLLWRLKDCDYARGPQVKILYSS